jgi:hypothetical protein
MEIVKAASRRCVARSHRPTCNTKTKLGFHRKHKTNFLMADTNSAKISCDEPWIPAHAGMTRNGLSRPCLSRDMGLPSTSQKHLIGSSGVSEHPNRLTKLPLYIPVWFGPMCFGHSGAVQHRSASGSKNALRNLGLANLTKSVIRTDQNM